ncbi:uncharacterized protein LOC110467394 [Mizuhopecten yessoensis]|uniref:THD domain-containing protein n=1 Tax=Mizuhopecten yessoensis TaxID=6573 RepID=A0A210R1B1_MIZYE|nr:uncharacterized protein LOC110467394 [Mizuhopecten yessoensis]OWF54840.1 hypothetical protein KP79_PYT20826 [Mizuhopecten yessoensis]
MGKLCCETTTKRGILKHAFFISVVVNIVLVTVLIILFIIRQTLRDREFSTTDIPSPKTGALKDTGGQLCLPCDFKGTKTNDTLYEFILQTKKNNTLCCLRRDDTLQNLILELEETNRRNGHYDQNNMNPGKLQWWRERNHAAHLYLNPFTNGITWREQGCKTSFLRNLTLTDLGRRLTIPDFSGAGMYFVYSVYTFDFGNEATDRQAPIGIHNVYHHSSSFINSNDRPLLWMSKLGGENTAKRQTSFLCGVVSMNMRDSIETEAVSIVAGKNVTFKHIDRLPYSNYFGMFKLMDFF